MASRHESRGVDLRGPSRTPRKKVFRFYTIWMAHDRPMTGLVAPREDEGVPWHFEEDKKNFRRIARIPGGKGIQHPDNKADWWATIGTHPAPHVMFFADKAYAESVAKAIGGFVQPEDLSECPS